MEVLAMCYVYEVCDKPCANIKANSPLFTGTVELNEKDNKSTPT